MLFFKMYEDIAISKGYTTKIFSDEIEVTQEEYDKVTLPAKKVNGEWVASEMPVFPEVDPYEGMTNEEIQAELLNTEKSVEFLGKTYTVNEADLVFNKYLALNDIARFTELSEKIVTATNHIYTRYPIEGQEMLTNTSIFSEMVKENTMLKSQVTALTQQNAFNEEVIYEIIMKIYE